MTEEQMRKLAYDEGFAAAEVVDTERIVFEESFRVYCEENLCGQYGANYACPPDCGSPEDMKQKISAHKKALVLQTIWQVSDYSDREATKSAKAAHNVSTVRLTKALREMGVAGFPVGSGGCSLCKPCKLKAGAPCAFPDLRYSCMSAYCIFVKKLADECGMEYTPGEGLLALFGMYVFD